MMRKPFRERSSKRKEECWALRRGERLKPVLVNREPGFGNIEENAVYRAIAYVEHVRSRRTRLRSNEYTALFFAALFGLIPLLLGYWPTVPLAVLLVMAIYVQFRARERREAIGHFFRGEQGVLKDLMMAGLPVRDWSLALWARHLAIQTPYWILAFNLLLLAGFVGLALWSVPYWIEDPWIPSLLCILAFGHMFTIAWYNARLSYLPWVELPAVVFQPRAFRWALRYLKRLPLQIEQGRVALLTQAWIVGVMGGAYGMARLIFLAERSGRLAGWRETAAYDILTFPPLWLGPGLFLGGLAGMLWGWRCRRRAEERLAKLDNEVAQLLELIRQRMESDDG